MRLFNEKNIIQVKSNVNILYNKNIGPTKICPGTIINFF
jgi:hypothetical protein